MRLYLSKLICLPSTCIHSNLPCLRKITSGLGPNDSLPGHCPIIPKFGQAYEHAVVNCVIIARDLHTVGTGIFEKLVVPARSKHGATELVCLELQGWLREGLGGENRLKGQGGPKEVVGRPCKTAKLGHRAICSTYALYIAHSHSIDSDKIASLQQH